MARKPKNANLDMRQEVRVFNEFDIDLKQNK